jgi:glc operon protein GlcG
MKHPRLASVASADLMAGSSGDPRVTYINHDKVADTLGNNGSLATAPDFLVMGAHRSGAGHAELHKKETDIFYVVDGEATFITGGAMVGSKATSPGQRTGTGIQGGEVHHLTKGDVIVIPAGIPHWFKDVPHSVSYFVVKVLKR